jgi:hypothetical protein
VPVRDKKEPPEGGSRCSQGGVKQSGQEPLNVQKLDRLIILLKP